MDFFCQLQERLLQDLRERIRRGETTERQLARTAGMSQPHMHHILKGARELTPAMADRILHSLGMGIPDLICDSCRLGAGENSYGPDSIELPVLAGMIGPGGEWPFKEQRFERYAARMEAIKDMQRPVALRLAADPAMTLLFGGGELAIADLGETGENCRPDWLYLVVRDGEVAARWIRVGRKRIYVASADDLDVPIRWEPGVPGDGEAGMKVVGRLGIIRPRAARPSDALPRRRPGISRGLARHTLAS